MTTPIPTDWKAWAAIALTATGILGGVAFAAITFFGGNTMQIQRLSDKMENAHNESVRLELQQNRQAEQTANLIDSIQKNQINNSNRVFDFINQNETRRDARDKALEDALNKLVDRVNAISQQLSTRSPRGELVDPLPSIMLGSR